jgi:hypothetical protein
MANKCMKKCYILSQIGKANQNYIQMPSNPSQNVYHQENKQQMLGRMHRVRELTPIHYWWECKLVQPLYKSVWRFLKKLKNKTTI